MMWLFRWKSQYCISLGRIFNPRSRAFWIMFCLCVDPASDSRTQSDICGLRLFRMLLVRVERFAILAPEIALGNVADPFDRLLFFRVRVDEFPVRELDCHVVLVVDDRHRPDAVRRPDSLPDLARPRRHHFFFSAFPARETSRGSNCRFCLFARSTLMYLSPTRVTLPGPSGVFTVSPTKPFKSASAIDIFYLLMFDCNFLHSDSGKALPACGFRAWFGRYAGCNAATPTGSRRKTVALSTLAFESASSPMTYESALSRDQPVLAL